MSALAAVLSYRDVCAGPLSGFSAEIMPSQTLVVAGAGAGKFLLFQLALGMVSTEAGSVTVLGKDPATLAAPDLRRLRARCGLLAHVGATISNLSVFDNVALSLRYHGLVDPSAVSDRVAVALETFGIGDLARQRPAALGELQRRLVGLARLEAAAPDLLLIQDPFEGMADAACERVHAWLTARPRSGGGMLITTNSERVDRVYDGRLTALANSRIQVHKE